MSFKLIRVSSSFSTVEKFCLYTFPTIHPILSEIFLFSSLLGTPVLVEIILQWEVVKLEFQKAFNTEENPLMVSRAKRNRGIAFGLIWVVITVVSTHDSRCSFSWFGGEQHPFLDRACIVFGNFAFFTATHSFFEDVTFIELLWASISALSNVAGLNVLIRNFNTTVIFLLGKNR